MTEIIMNGLCKFFSIMALLFMAFVVIFITIGSARAEEIRFQWDYEADSVEVVKQFRLFMRTEGAAYDYTTPAAIIPITDGQPDGEGNVTFGSGLEIELPADTRGQVFFVMRARDEFGNESGDSNEVDHKFSTLPVPAVLRFQIILDVIEKGR